jgi:hypothetical protein
MRAHVASALMVLLALGAAQSVDAERLGAGNTVVWLGLNGNQAQLVGPTTDDPVFENGEVGLHAAFSYFLSDDWTVVVSGGFDVGSIKHEPIGGTERKLSSNSWNARLGFDRYAFINEDVAIYAGPGIRIWTGSAEFDGSGNPAVDIEWPEVQQVAFNGRIGMYARIQSRYALFGHIGQVIGTNRADDNVGDVSWWSSHHEGSVGLAFDF